MLWIYNIFNIFCFTAHFHVNCWQNTKWNSTVCPKWPCCQANFNMLKIHNKSRWLSFLRKWMLLSDRNSVSNFSQKIWFLICQACHCFVFRMHFFPSQIIKFTLNFNFRKIKIIFLSFILMFIFKLGIFSADQIFFVWRNEATSLLGHTILRSYDEDYAKSSLISAHIFGSY